eukprot:g6809.t1
MGKGKACFAGQGSARQQSSWSGGVYVEFEFCIFVEEEATLQNWIMTKPERINVSLEMQSMLSKMMADPNVPKRFDLTTTNPDVDRQNRDVLAGYIGPNPLSWKKKLNELVQDVGEKKNQKFGCNLAEKSQKFIEIKVRLDNKVADLEAKFKDAVDNACDHDSDELKLDAAKCTELETRLQSQQSAITKLNNKVKNTDRAKKDSDKQVEKLKKESSEWQRKYTKAEGEVEVAKLETEVLQTKMNALEQKLSLYREKLTIAKGSAMRGGSDRYRRSRRNDDRDENDYVSESLRVLSGAILPALNANEQKTAAGSAEMEMCLLRLVPKISELSDVDCLTCFKFPKI